MMKRKLLNTKIQTYTVILLAISALKIKSNNSKLLLLDDITNSPIEFNIKIDEKTIKAVISPMFTKNKDYVGYIIVLIDMTKEAEMDLMRANFISNVSHELRTPVTVLRSYIDTLYTMGDEFDYETQKEFIGTINREIIV
jgi:signal transduction histidine kinase